MTEIGCYSLHLYCDLPGHEEELQDWYRGEFAGHTYRQCVRAARLHGWRRLRGKGRWACPRHPAKGPFQPHPDDVFRDRRPHA